MAAPPAPHAAPSIAVPRLEAHALAKRPDVAFLPDAVSPAAEASLLAALGFQRRAGGGGDYAFNPAAPPPGWTRVAGRAVRALGGAVDAHGALLPAPMPAWLQGLMDRLAASGAGGSGGPANHVLANAYGPGSGVAPHADGPVYAPRAVIVSLGGWAVLRFYEKGVESGRRLLFSVAAPPRSVVAFWGAAYADCLHGIDDVAADVLDGSIVNAVEAGLAGKRGGCQEGGGDPPSSAHPTTMPRSVLRVSLTVRRVLRVRKGLALRLGAR